MHLSEKFFLKIENKNIIPIIAAGTGCGKSTYIYNKLNKDLGIALSEILVVTHLTSMKEQQTEVSSFDFGLDVWGIDKDDDSIQFLRYINRLARGINLNRKSYKDNYNDIANVTDYHSMENFIKSNYCIGVTPNFEEKGIKCIVIDEAHELLMGCNYRPLQYLWNYLMQTDIYVVFLSATPEILLLPGINTYNKKFQVVYSSKSNIPINSINVQELKNSKRNRSKYIEIKNIIKKNTDFKSFTIINDKKLIQNVSKLIGNDAIGLWSTSDYRYIYTEKMNDMRSTLLKEEKYLDDINHMIATNAYGTGINIKDINIDTVVIFYSSIENLVQNVSRLRLGVKKLIIVKDDINWIAEDLIRIREEFLTFKKNINYYLDSRDCKSYFKIITERLKIQDTSNKETIFVTLDNNYEPIINYNIEIVINYLLQQIENIDNNINNIHDILGKYFEYIPEKEMSIDEKNKAAINFIKSKIEFKKDKAILFSKNNHFGYFSLEELKIEMSKIYKKKFTTTSIRKLLLKLNYDLDTRKTSKTINSVKHVAYQLYELDKC